jgi:hypothetical protein
MDDSLSAYMHVLLESSAKIAEEYYSMNKDRVTLEQVVERLGLTKQWEARGKSEGIAIGGKQSRCREGAAVAGK